MARRIEPLILQAMPQSRRYVLARDWSTLAHTQRFIVPMGFQTDGASIPRALWFLIGSPFAPEVIEAAVLHDAGYAGISRNGDITDKRERRAMRAEADLIFRVMLRRAGVGALRAWLMWAGVRLFGWLFYKGPASDRA